MTEPATERRDWTLAYILGAAVAAFAVLAVATAPVSALLGDSAFAIPSALHGVSSILYVIVATMLAYLAYQMYVGRLERYREARFLSLAAVFLSSFTILLGNWIYIAYRDVEGPRAYFLENEPAVHTVFFESKEFLALFTLPLSVAAAYMLLKHRHALHDMPRERQATAILLVLSWLLLVVVFGLGAAITKLRSV